MPPPIGDVLAVAKGGTARHITVLVLIAVAGLIAIAGVDNYFRTEAQHSDATALQSALVHTTEQLTESMHYSISAVESLAGFMQASPTLPGFDRFDEFSALLLARHKSIHGLAYIDRHGVIRHFYPRRGNEAAIGLDLKLRPAAPFVATAIGERRTTVNHPTHTVQGSLSIIARTPFYRDGQLAGLVQGVFDIADLVADATAVWDPRIGYELRDANGQRFHGTGSLPDISQTAIVKLGDNHWQLGIGWLSGAPGPAPALLGLLWIGGILLLTSLLVLIRRTQVRELWLRTAVAERTRALRDNEARLRAVVSNAPVVLYTLDHEGIIRLSEGKGLSALQLRPGETVGRSVFDMYRDYPDIIANVRRALAGEPVVHVVTLGPLTFEVHYSPTFGADGQVESVIGLAIDISARKLAEDALIQSESNFRALTENANVGILVNYHGKHVFANNRGLEMLGYTADEIHETGIEELVHPSEHDKVMTRFRERQQGLPVPRVYESVFVTRSGQPLPVELTAAQTTWHGESAGLVMFHDISERQKSESQMRKLSSALEQAADSVMITDRNGIIEYVNPAYVKTTGYAREEVLGHTPRLVKSGKQGEGFYKKLWGTILAGEVFSDVFINRRKDGGLYCEETTITPLRDASGEIASFISTGKDVTERMQTQERLEHMAHHDALTGLPNRLLFMDRLKQALARARWHERLVAVLFIDMDRFKTINDTLGHEAGDRLLQVLAERLDSSVREGDTVARFGGDEFVVLLDDVASEKDTGAVAQKVLDALAPPLNIEGQNLYVTASIGISLYPIDGEDSGTLLKNADIAMYRSKDLGKNTYQFYSADMSARAFERLTLESSLRHAIKRNEFRLHYQPVLDITSGKVVGVEALLRWQHPDFGLISPVDFIPLLEETGLIVPAGDWILRTACEQLRAWHRDGWPQLRMAINLSPRQFQTDGLVQLVKDGLSTLGCDPQLLELEITENLLLRHTAVTLETLDALRGLGVRLAIDDFGTGYSSLGYLRRYSIDTLKIDRSFVHDVLDDSDDSALASAIIVLAQSLNLHVIAEGVETGAQRDFLQQRGCHLMQGYLFSMPLPAEDIPRLLAERNPPG